MMGPVGTKGVGLGLDRNLKLCLGLGLVWTCKSNFRLDGWCTQIPASFNDKGKSTVQTQLRWVQTLYTVSLSGSDTILRHRSDLEINVWP